jgi:triphosphoribosyl-dephospho-CoA synthase
MQLRRPEPATPARLADLVVDVLVEEAHLAPKPGLVDSRGNGAHRDLNLALMCASAQALQPAFVAMAEAGIGATGPTQALREQLGRLGRKAEAAMMHTTRGVNTHRGAIWSMGLLVAAAMLEREEPEPSSVAATAGAIARMPDRFLPSYTGNKGEQACRDYGVGGARGQAQAGFPHVIALGLPELRSSRTRGDTENAARLNALLAIMSRLDDTCVLSRAGEVALSRVQTGAARVLAAGGAGRLDGRRLLRKLDADALEHNVSPGGAADLLAATLFLDRLPTRFW